MAISKQNKTQLISAMGRTKSKAHRLVLALRFQGRNDEARRVASRAKKLSRQIDELLAAAMGDWLGNAESIKTRLSRSNSRLQAAVREIEKKNKVSENVVKAVSLIDLVIEAGSNLLR